MNKGWNSSLKTPDLQQYRKSIPGHRKFDQALKFTLKSLDLDHEQSTAQMNLGSIYRDLGDAAKR